MFAGLRRAVDARKRGKTVRLKSAPKYENKTYHHFTPIKGQASARTCLQKSFDASFSLQRQGRLPKAILSHHGSQFKEQWRELCSQCGIEAHFAPPSYPQDKGKVERCIQNLNREFINQLRKIPKWLDGQIGEYKDWFNHSRFHRGVKTYRQNSTSVKLES